MFLFIDKPLYISSINFLKKSLISILGSKNIFITLFWIFRGAFDGLLELTFFNYKLKKQGQILKKHLKD